MTEAYILGVDPAATSGFALCHAEPGGLRLLEAWHVTRPSPSKSRSQAECDAASVQLIAAALHRALTSHTVERTLHLAIEDPSDVSTGWSHRRQGGRVSGRGTACRIGAAYGLALAGATACTVYDRIASYQVRGTATAPGWMTGLFGRRADRTSVYWQLRALITSSKPSIITIDLTEDELAAYGVALWHWTLTQAKARRA